MRVLSLASLLVLGALLAGCASSHAVPPTPAPQQQVIHDGGGPFGDGGGPFG